MQSLINTLGGPAGFGENTFARNDDGYTGAIDITSVFGPQGIKFGDSYYTQMYIANNGLISFGTPENWFPSSIDGGFGADIPFIVAYGMDLDTRYGYVAPSPDGTSTGSNLVYWDIDTANGQITVTWDDVGVYSNGSIPTVAGQIILTDMGNGNMEVELRYEYAELVNGRNGIAGINVGIASGTEGRDYYAIANTASDLSNIDTQAGNTGIEGYWKWFIRDGVISQLFITNIADDTGISATDFVTSDTSLTVMGTVGSLEEGDTVQISIDVGASWSDLTVTGGTWSYVDGRSLSEGNHTYMVRVIDTEETVLSSNSQIVMVDTTAPSAAIAITAVADDTGVSASDFITSDTNLSVSGTVGTLGADEMAQISVDGGTSWSDLTVSSGTWSYADGRLLTDGDYIYDVRVMDTAGNIGATDTQTVTVDTTAPSTGIAITAISDDTCPVGDFVTGDISLSVSGTVGALGAGEKAQISINGGTSWSDLTVASGTWSYEDSRLLADGDYTYNVRLIDAAGNVGSTDTQVVSVDTIRGTAIGDKLTGTAFCDGIYGLGGDDIIKGGAGNDLIDGGTGADKMYGGLGDDTFYIDHSSDYAVEFAGEGNDTVITTLAKYTLATNVENLIYEGKGSTALTGNALDNVITALAGSDFIDGGKGADTMTGGAGGDTYIVDNALDAVVENEADDGTDTVKTTLNDYTLADNVENLTYTGITASLLRGNALDNVIVGSNGSDTIDGSEGDDALYGGAGNDILTGGAGEDAFFFTSTLNSRSNVDTITDFESGADMIHLENAIFTKLGAAGALNASMFVVGTHALDTNDYIIYDETSGKLYYDADGSGRAAAVQIALIGTAEHPELSAADFAVI